MAGARLRTDHPPGAIKRDPAGSGLKAGNISDSRP